MMLQYSVPIPTASPRWIFSAEAAFKSRRLALHKFRRVGRRHFGGAHGRNGSKGFGRSYSGDLRRADRARRCSVIMMRVFIGVHTHNQNPGFFTREPYENVLLERLRWLSSRVIVRRIAALSAAMLNVRRSRGSLRGIMRCDNDEIPSKVPAVTLGFWVIKILATTLGETGGDSVTMTWLQADQSAHGGGYLIGTGIFPRCAHCGRSRPNLGQKIQRLDLLAGNHRLHDGRHGDS